MSKVKEISRENLSWLKDQPVEVKLEVLKEIQLIYQLLANEILEDFTFQYTGSSYNRGSIFNRNGSNPSSIKFKGEKIPVKVPRIQNKATGQSYNVPEFKELKDITGSADQFINAVLAGLSTRNYEKIVGQFVNGFGLSKSSVSKEFVRQSAEKLKELHTRRLEEYTFVALQIDGKSVSGNQVIIALGITDKGDKKVLGLTQSASEHHRPVEDLLRNILGRGFQFKEGLLAVLDGSKGLSKAVKNTFGHQVLIQRCTWHKRENVLSYLSNKDRPYWKSRIQNAYALIKYKQAKAELCTIIKELELINQSAANSLKEGLEQTLTLHKLSINFEFARSLSTTNCIENLNGSIQRKIRNNCNWKNSLQVLRWVAASCLSAEKKMRKIQGYKQIPKLVKAIKKSMKKARLK